MPINHLTQEINTLKGLLALWSKVEDPTLMKEVFNSFLLTNKNIVPDTVEYSEIVEFYRTKGGLKGYLTYMGL